MYLHLCGWLWRQHMNICCGILWKYKETSDGRIPPTVVACWSRTCVKMHHLDSLMQKSEERLMSQDMNEWLLTSKWIQSFRHLGKTTIKPTLIRNLSSAAPSWGKFSTFFFFWMWRVHAHVWLTDTIPYFLAQVPTLQIEFLHSLVISICPLLGNGDGFSMSWVKCWRRFFQFLTMQQHSWRYASSSVRNLRWQK